MDALLQDLRYAVRMLVRAPLFTVVTVVTLAIGIGGTTVAFSLFNAVLLRPLPIPEADRVVALAQVRQQHVGGDMFTYPEYREYRDRNRSFSDLAALGDGTFGLNTGDEVSSISAGFATGNYFRLLRLRPEMGRFLTPEDDTPGGDSRVAVLSHDLWVSRFGADPGVVGRSVKLNGQAVRVVGVVPASFQGSSLGSAPGLWVPMAARTFLAPRMIDQPGMRLQWLQVLGRLRPGVEPAAAQEEMSALARAVDARSERPAGLVGMRLTRAGGPPSFFRGIATGILTLLLGAAGLVLLIAAANVAGMLLARSSARRREIAVRLAMGAQPRRVVRQLVTESVLLALLGGAGGLLLAGWATNVLRGIPAALPIPGHVALDFHPDARVLVFALALSLLSGVLFGLAPALQAVRPELVPALKDSSPGAGRRSRLRDAFVVGQIALSLVLLLSAGLFLRALQRAVHVDPGFDAAGVTVAAIDLSPYGYDEQSGTEFYRQLLERLRATPGVQSASVAQLLPLIGYEMSLGVRFPGKDEPESVRFNAVSEDYFRTLRIPVLRGRVFGPQDRRGAPQVVVVNDAFVRRYFRGENPLGRTLDLGDVTVQVVGVVADSKWRDLREPPTPMGWRPLTQAYAPGVNIQVRTAGSAAAFGATLKRLVREMNPSIPVRPYPMTEAVAAALLPQKLGVAVAGAFGLVGLLLAAVGLYGVMAYSVSQRTRELGIRTALGASANDTVRLVLRHALALMALGAVLGAAAGLGATRLLTSLLFGVSPTDPLAFLAVLTILAMVALVASLAPARRATRVDPMVALRAE